LAILWVAFSIVAGKVVHATLSEYVDIPWVFVTVKGSGDIVIGDGAFHAGSVECCDFVVGIGRTFMARNGILRSLILDQVVGLPIKLVFSGLNIGCEVGNSYLRRVSIFNFQ
jgi:hypothetical protein